MVNQTGNDTATEEEDTAQAGDTAGGRKTRRACPKSCQISEGREKSRRACKQRREEVRKVSKKRESKRYQITNAGSRRHRGQGMPAKRTTSPKFALNRIKWRFARLRQFRSIWKEYEAVRKYKKEHQRKQGKTDTAKPCK